jgi:YVTN family beta-propeller protein
MRFGNRWSAGALVLAGAAVSLAAAAPHSAVAQKPYRVLHTWQLGGEGGWDYLTMDAAAHRLYIDHNVTVDVIDTDTGKKVGEIAGLGGTHGVALGPDGKYGYISDGRSNTVVIFDRHSLAKLATVPVEGKNPDGIAYEPVTKTVWTFDGRSNTASVVDTATRKLVATIPLPGRPEFPAADGRGFMFDNLESTSQLVKIDAKTDKIVAVYPLTGCDSPSGLAIDRKDRKLISVCQNKVMAITDADTGKVVATVPIGEGPDATRYDPKTGLAFSTNGETGDMTIVDLRGKTPHVIQTLATAKGARTMALDAQTGETYTVTAQFGPRPAPSADNPHGRPPIVPGSFEVIVAGR